MKLTIIFIFSMAQLKDASTEKEWITEHSFPDDFMFGVSTSAYQIEGAWNLNGKSSNIWDELTHQHPEAVSDKSNGDIACDSYHKLHEDVKLLKDLGVQFYRFSISWSRLLPTGFHNQINQDAVRYYNELIDLLVENGIQPMVTLLHMDTPEPLDVLGGFSNELMIDWFEEYARVAFDNFGDRVKLWLTFNDPHSMCVYDCGRIAPPGRQKPKGIFEYICSRVVLKAHARAYHIYDKEYRHTQKGKISYVTDAMWFEPGSKHPEDIEAAQRVMDFVFGLFADPVYHPKGGYPESVKKIVAERSAAEGFKSSRLPSLSDDEIENIRETADFLALNHYTTFLVDDQERQPIGLPSFDNDMGAKRYADPSWPKAGWISVVPWGFRKLLKYIKGRYGDIEIYVTENGYSDYGGKSDELRIDYHKQYLNSCLKAIHEDKVNVKGYSVWSLMDNFEWMVGYTSKFGLYEVNFNDPKRPRTPKLSAKFYKQLIIDRKISHIHPVNRFDGTVDDCKTGNKE